MVSSPQPPVPSPQSLHMISVIIPTYNEAAVIEETLRRAAAALRSAGEDFELVVVDDASADGTAERVESLADEIPVRVLRRPGRLGLATAVLDGWATARGDVWGVMDADLQHPPETLTALAAAIRQGADLAIGSRYVPGGGTSDWTWVRRFISRTATHMAATVLPLKLAVVGDPMSGIFMVRASALRRRSTESRWVTRFSWRLLPRRIIRTWWRCPTFFRNANAALPSWVRANMWNISSTWGGWRWGRANSWAGSATAWWRSPAP